MLSLAHMIMLGLFGGIVRVVIGYSKIYGPAGIAPVFEMRKALFTIVVAMFSGALSSVLISSDSYAVAVIAGFAGADLLEALAKGLMYLKSGYVTGFKKSSYNNMLGDFTSMKLSKSQTRSVNYVRKYGAITNDEYQRINKVSHSTASRDLSQLVRMRILQKVGKGSSVKYKTL